MNNIDYRINHLLKDNNISAKVKNLFDWDKDTILEIKPATKKDFERIRGVFGD